MCEYATQKITKNVIHFLCIVYIHTNEPTVEASLNYLYLLIYHLNFDLLEKQKQKDLIIF